MGVVQLSSSIHDINIHGHDSYRRSAELVQFVIHRRLIIFVMQAAFSFFIDLCPCRTVPGLTHGRLRPDIHGAHVFSRA